MMREVVVTQRRLTHYRVPFFECLRTELAERRIRLRLVHGEPTAAERSKNDCGHLPWAIQVPTRYWLAGRLCWLKQKTAIRGAELVVLTPENKMLSNLPLQYFSLRQRVVLWGHGANLQGNPASLRERFKRVVARRADWWLGYTDMSSPLIAQSGFPSSRTTILQNAVDTTALTQMSAAVTADAQAALRHRLGLQHDRVGIYLGSLYQEKRIAFLLDAALKIRARMPEFELLIVGGGPQQAEVESFCAQHDWAHYLGVCKDRAKVEALSLARVMLNPGLVGLGILDSFACGVPMITTDCGLHSPEIAYLRNGENGMMTANHEDSFVSACVAVLADPALHLHLHEGCAESARRYTIANMARNFADGIEQCLAAPPYRGAA